MISPLKLALLVTTTFHAPAALAATSCGTAAPNYAAAVRGFSNIDGTMYNPDRTPFVARGINVLDGNLASVAGTIDKTFPGINFIRVPVYKNKGAYADPSTFAAAVKILTAKGIVVEFEDHTTSTGGDAGGGQGVIFSGQMLADELAWDTAMAKAFATNPYVWFGTNNEPPLKTTAGGPDNIAALSTWQGEQYDAIRKAGNNNPILLAINGWADPTSFAKGYTPSVYAKMTNVVADVHIYPWLFKYSTDQAFVDKQIAAMIAQTQARLPTADGKMPILIGEYGQDSDKPELQEGGLQVINAVANAAKNGVSSAAWYYATGHDGLINANGSLSAYGQKVASFIAGSGSTGCPVSPLGR